MASRVDVVAVDICEVMVLKGKNEGWVESESIE
jgi:hypothetical protein